MATSLSSPQWFTAAVNANKDSSIYPLNSKLKSMTDSLPSRRSTLCKMVEIPKKTKKNLKPVKFEEGERSVVVHQLESDADVDPQDLWFSKQDIRAMRQEGRDTLAKVKQAGGDASALDESNTIRGLEHGLSGEDGWDVPLNEDADSRTILGRSERRKNIIGSILAQQQEQKDAGIDDPKGLAVTSKASTQWARDRAFDVAQQDFADAVEVWRADADCAVLLPNVLNKKSRRRRSSVLSSSTTSMSADERKATLASISRTVASALEELDDLDDLDF